MIDEDQSSEVVANNALTEFSIVLFRNKGLGCRYLWAFYLVTPQGSGDTAQIS